MTDPAAAKPGLALVAGTLPQQNPGAPHVLLVLDGFPKVLGGGERIALRIADLLQRAGFRVSMLTFRIDPECTALDTPPPCPLYLLPLSSTYDWTALRGAWSLRRFLKAEHVAIVQTFFESSDLWAGLVTKAASSAALIWNRRDMGILRQPKHTLAYRLMRRLPDRVFAVSEKVRRYSIEIDRIDPARVTTLYNGVDLASWPRRRDPITITGRPFRIVTLGNIRPVKGHDVLIEAAALILRTIPEGTFTIVGEVLDAAYFATLERRIVELGLTGRVLFTGNVQDPRGLLMEADLFILPSRSEGFSNAVLEAMAAALPVVATAVGGNAEAIVDGETGLLVPPEDPGAMAEAVLSLLLHPERLTAMSAAARQRLEARFTTDAMITHMLAEFSTLLAR